MLFVYVPVKPIATDAFAAIVALYGSFVAVTASPVCVYVAVHIWLIF